jgi:hypothetical protein
MNLRQRIYEMTDDRLARYAEEHKLDLSEREFESPEEARAFICKQLQVDSTMKDEPAAGADLDEEVQEYQRKHGCTYTKALADLSKNPEFLRRWELIFE